MDLKKFKEMFDEACDNIGIYGEEGNIASHKLKGHIEIEEEFIKDGEEDVNFYDMIEFCYTRLPGCGCPSGLVIKIKKEIMKMTKEEKEEFLIEYSDLINDEYGEMLHHLYQVYHRSEYLNNSEFIKCLEKEVDDQIDYLKKNTKKETKKITRETTHSLTEVIFLDQE